MRRNSLHRKIKLENSCFLYCQMSISQIPKIDKIINKRRQTKMGVK